MSIFKAYDIRGTYPNEVNENVFHKIGMAAAKTLFGAGAPQRRVVVGHDARVSSPQLADALVKGLLAAGVAVTEIGQVSTPMLYYATTALKADAGFQVTASHNPGNYNGLKICRAQAAPVSATDLEALEQNVFAADPTPAAQAGAVAAKDIAADYLAMLTRYIDSIAPLTVVVDAGNGVMGEFLPPLFAKLPCELLPLYFEPDGNFPHHEPNPLEARNLQDLCAKVSATRADVGVAFDGDGDRAVFVDETGKIISGDLITAILAREALRRSPGAAIIYDLRSSRAVAEEIAALGGRPVVSRVGHSFIKQLMRDENAEFAGELSGHFYFRELFCADNAELAMLALLRAVSRSPQKKLSALVAPLQRYAATGEINFTVNNPQEKLAGVEQHFVDAGGAEISHLDGLTVNFPDWWFNLRSSNTEPMLRLNLEAATAARRDEKQQEVEKLIFG
ncbi:MAG: phosphomannomutase/phosphoglucomutase [Planctomycetota bacterium]|jgi:phosphomannomutase|nr:phosphomannomutase/phosphoglucomutase [Planctomycetota bacterium]